MVVVGSETSGARGACRRGGLGVDLSRDLFSPGIVIDAPDRRWVVRIAARHPRDGPRPLLRRVDTLSERVAG